MEGEPKETSDLLVVYKNDGVQSEAVNLEHTNGHANGVKAIKSPPDGGLRAIMVVIGASLTNGLLFGVINSWSDILNPLEKQLIAAGVPNAKSRASLVGSLAIGTTFFMSPLSGILTGFFGIRTTAILGGSIAALGMLISSFVVHNVDALTFTYGLMYGFGAALAYTPSLAILSHYFKKYLGIANGVVAVGSPVFTVIVSTLMDHLIKNYGLGFNLRIMSILTFGVALCGILFKPASFMVEDNPLKGKKTAKDVVDAIVCVEIWRRKKYRLWAIFIPIALFGYFVPYSYIKNLTEVNFPDYKGNYNTPLQCIAAMSGIGRLFIGWLADRPGIDRILLQQISFYAIGTFCIILPFVTEFWMLVVVALFMGLFDGAFIALIGPIAVEICGTRYAAQSIGCMLGLAALPICLGPPIAAKLYEACNNNYTVPFVLAGISPIVGASLMFAIRLYRNEDQSVKRSNGHGPTSNGSAA